MDGFFNNNNNMKFIKYIILFFSLNLFAQNTIGIINNDAINSYNGYTLLAPLSSTETYLINNCGQVVNQWSSTFTPGASVYLLQNGNLLRTGKIINDDITFGGVGGKLELYDWDGNLLWEYTHSSSEISQHHDIYPMPNGNILMIAVDTMTESEAIDAGRDPSKIQEGKIFNEQILELEPIGTNQVNIVWEWNIKDHLIQDFDSDKANYGVVADNPQLLDFNYISNINDLGNANWLHINSIQYNSDLDQIVISTRNLNEIYIIEHTDSTLDAQGQDGGAYGKGGDFLYRWGNKASYDFASLVDRTLVGQHNPHWIPEALTDADKIMIFNNGNIAELLYSTVDIIDPPQISAGFYEFDAVTGYGPEIAEWRYIAPNPTDFYSAILSSGQRLPNGNTLICDGDSGYFFEIDTNNNKVWEYINPVSNLGILSQGDTPSANLVFRAIKYSPDYTAFDGRDLTPSNPIELNFDLSSCQLLSIDEYSISDNVSIYPNPTSDMISLSTELNIDKIEIFNVYGKLILSERNQKTISLKNISTGIYFMKFYSDGKFGNKKFIKQ